jgi:hypothetical protein
MDWNPCPDPVKDPTRHPRLRPVAVRRSAGKHFASSLPSPCALRALSLSHEGRGRGTATTTPCGIASPNA